MIELLAASERAPATAPLWIFGGEPTLRSDLPELIAQLTKASRVVGLRTDGLVFKASSTAQPLISAGLGAVRVRLHAKRQDAHDWLSGVGGSWVRALRAAAIFIEAGLRVELETVVSRVNAPHLREVVQLAHELRVAGIHFERLVLTHDLANDAVALSPRFGLLEPQLEDAAALAARLGIRATFWQFPPCTLGEARAARASSPNWLTASTWPSLGLNAVSAPDAVRCGACTRDCEGAPSDYIKRFGPGEFRSEAGSLGDSTVIREGDLAPARGRGERAPATRLRVVHELLGRAPSAAASISVPRVLRVRWRGPTRLREPYVDEPGEAPEPTRLIRQRLVQAAQHGARRLRVVGDAVLTHAAVAELLGELPLLAIPELELCGEGSALSELPQQQLQTFACLRRLDIPLFGADARGHDARVSSLDAFDRTLSGLERLQRNVALPVSVFAVLGNEASAGEFAEAWAIGALPGRPQFRLAARGGSLDALADELDKLPHEPSSSALSRLLPPCLTAHGVDSELDSIGPELGHPERAASSCDRLGSYLPCRCRAGRARRCPGIAVGWTTERIEPT